MKSKIFKTIILIGLAAILSLTPAIMPLAMSGNTVSGSAVSDGGNAEIKGKDEVIYATLAPDGSVRAIYVVNCFAIAEAGSITDYGDYKSVINLTDTTPITQNGDVVTVQANVENIYYQGNMTTTELPWIFDILHSLDGVKTAPQELAGKSGKLEIHINSKKNDAVNTVFCENYMLQISITLDTEKCSDIKAPNATVASAGRNKVIAYTVMPGKDVDISLSTTVRDFTMAGIDISAMPFSMNMVLPDTDNMINDFAKLSDAISDLNNGVGELADGVAELKTGADKLNNGSSDIKAGLSELSDNSGQFIQASSQISGALAQIASSLNGASWEMDLNDLTQLPQGLSQLAHGLDSISGGLSELRNGFTSAYAALDGAIQGIPNVTITQEQIMGLYAQTDPSQYGLLGQLIDSYTAGQIVKGTYNQAKGGFDAVAPAIDTLSASIDMISATLDDMSKKIGDALLDMDITQQLAQLTAGLSELNRNYTAFHNGLTYYMNGVSELSSGYPDFHKGMSLFGDSIGKLHDGVVKLHDGTTKLSDETVKIPDTIQEEIDDMLDEYTGSDFEPVSFTSSKNKHIDQVQFVLKCDGIEKSEETKDVEVVTKKETFWDRFMALFTGYNLIRLNRGKR